MADAETGPGATVSDIGEFGVIARVTRGHSQPHTTILGPGDDAAVLRAPDGRIVVTTDMLVQDRHFRLDWSTPQQVGRKAIAQNGADIAAMGARPCGYLVSLGCPASTPIEVIDGLTDGMWQEAALTGAGIVGGDLVQSPVLVISVTALGDLAGRAPVLLSGAEAGDVVAVCGRLGASAAGLALLSAQDGDFPEILEAHRCPAPAYRHGPAAADAGATSMTDNSDGLLADLGHIAEASGVAIDVRAADLPVGSGLAAAASRLGLDVLDWLLSGGEDHALLATFPPTVDLPDGWTAIGAAAAGAGVTVDGVTWQGRPGWQSFSELIIERADVTDPEVAVLIEEVQAEYVRRYGGPDSAPLHPEQFRSPAGVFLIARDNGAVVGMGGWRCRHAGADDLRDGDAEIKRMYVRPQAQRRGIARALLAELEASARQAGRTRMVLETGTEQPEAVALYSAAGYLPIVKFGYYAHEAKSLSFGKVIETHSEGKRFDVG